MRLLRLELLGFKSFCDKTVLTFTQNGISSVIGPNGCGKSNIIDAIRWTLGEQSAKHLRGSNMEDVIFSGSENRKPVNMAQVTLAFSNPGADILPKFSEFNEITVTRKLFRSGESAYLINDTPARLMDIRELFMDTGIGGKGYSIIEQGRIGQIINTKPEERRIIIDEAAGILKFKTRRQDAEKKLAQTQQNLEKVELILNELTDKEEILKEQVAKADEYIETEARVKHLQKCLQASEWAKLKANFDEIADQRDELKKSHDSSETKVATLEAREATMQLEITQLESQLETKAEERQEYHKKIQDIETQIQLNTQALENIEEWESKGGREIQRLQTHLAHLEEELEASEKQTTQINAEIESKQMVLDEMDEQKRIKEKQVSEKNMELESTRQKQLKLVTEISAHKNQIQQLSERLDDFSNQTEKLEKQSEFKKIELEKIQDQIQFLETDLEQFAQQQALIKEKSEQLRFEIEQKNETQKHQQRMLEDVRREINQAESRLESIQEMAEKHEEFDSATRTFLEYLQNHPESAKNLGFLGTLPEWIQTKEGIPEPFIHFLDQHFNLLIFQDYKKLGQISALCEDLKSGQVEIYFLNQPDSVDDISASTQQSLNQWLDVQNQEEVPSFIRQTLLIEQNFHEIDEKQIQLQVTMIDPKGSILNREKTFFLGRKTEGSRTSLLLERKKEIERLESNLKKLTAKEEQSVIQWEENAETIQENERSLENINKDINELELKLVSGNKEQENLQREEKKLSRELEEVTAEKEVHLSQHQKLVLQKDELSESLEKDRDQQKEQEKTLLALQRWLEEARIELSDEVEEIQRQKIMLNGLNNQLNSVKETGTRIQRDIHSVQVTLEREQSESSQKAEKSTKLKTSMDELEEKLPSLLDLLSEKEKEFQVTRNQVETLKAEALETQKDLRREQKMMEANQKENVQYEVKIGQLAQKSEDLEAALFEEFSVTPQEALKLFNIETFETEKEKSSLRNLKKKLESLGHVNMGAKEEYTQLFERLVFLREQSKDLIESMEALETSIQKMNRESKKRFRDAFKQVNENFQRLFPEMFGGGKAHLEMTDEDNPLETGIEIIAQPPGKRLQNLTLLSGGEKALTAISLVFSIFLIKPSPFCVLDEVDAPLDDANVGRFNQALVKMTENSQFILITHNKKTMEIADSMFGVTMEDPGVSKIVSVNFHNLNYPTH